MTSAEAVKELVFDYASDRKRSKASYRRVKKALAALGIIPGLGGSYEKCMQTLGYFADGCTKPYERYL